MTWLNMVKNCQKQKCWYQTLDSVFLVQGQKTFTKCNLSVSKITEHVTQNEEKEKEGKPAYEWNFTKSKIMTLLANKCCVLLANK